MPNPTHNEHDAMSWADVILPLRAPGEFPSFNRDRRMNQQLLRWARKEGLPTSYFDIIQIPPNHRLMAIRNRLRVMRTIRENAAYCDLETGKTMMYVEVWQRDCDMCEDSSLYECEASYRALSAMMDKHNKYAEGMITHTVLTPDEAEAFQSYSRDLALEAFEEGHQHVCYA